MNSATSVVVPDVQIRVSPLRKLASVLFGFAYGGSVLNGVEQGLTFVLGREDFDLLAWPWANAGVMVATAGLAGFLAAYSSRSFIVGLVATSITSAVPVVLRASGLDDGAQELTYVAATLMWIAGAILSVFAGRLKIRPADVTGGRLFGISWKHWTWLFIPWQAIIATAVWLAFPLALLGEGSRPWGTVVFQILRAPVYVLLLACAWFKALQALQAASELTRLQSIIRFCFWVFIVPILINGLRLFGW